MVSANSNYVAMIQPARGPAGDGGEHPVLTVCEVRGGASRPRWKVDLCNRLSPVAALITDDGRYVVTFDNWHSVGYGDDVMVFYSAEGLIRKYSLETLLAELPGTNGPLKFYELFSHSVSSRWWRNGCISVFAGTGAEASFGMWLDYAGRWFVWRLADGTVEPLHAERLRAWNARGRQWALDCLAAPEVAGRPSPTEMLQGTPAAMSWSGRSADRYGKQIIACRYLAYCRDPADRARLEQLLGSREEDANWIAALRQNADRALAIWDGKATDFRFSDGFPPETWYRLGTVRLFVDLPKAPVKGEGQLYVSIYPDTVRESDWRGAPAEFRGGLSFLSDSSPLTTEVRLKTPPLRPGRYWVKAVWDRKPPFQYNLWAYEGMRAWKESTEPAPAAEAGDLESVVPAYFEVTIGQASEVRVQCTEPGSRAAAAQVQ